MGHDVHFLRRVDRLRSEHAELALGLYRDHRFVRYLLARLSVPERDQRVAIALGDDVRGPFVIVTREGRFVTCLGENMRLRGDETLVPRHRLDALSRHVSELRQLMEDARAGRNHQTKLLLQRVLDTGPSLSREEFVACSRWTPLAVHIFVDKLVMLNRTSRQLYERLRRVKSLSRKHADAFTEFHRQSWAILHLTLLLGSDHGEALERVLSDLLPEPDRPPFARSVILCGMRQGTLSAVARSVWLSSKLPRLLLDQLRQDYASTCLLSLVLRYGMSLSALGLRHQRLNAKVRKTFHRCDLPDERKAAELGFRQFLAKTHDRVVAQQDALRARILEDALAVLKDVAEQEGEPVEEAPPRLVEDLAVPVLFAASDPLVGQDMVAPILFEWLPWIARANAPDFFAPEAYVAGRESSLNPDAGYLLVRVREMMEENHRFPVDQPERPGRNDPCSCGSGKKYKRCCG